ncbi:MULTISPECIES: thiamine/thiamine pyrophosphate ABC transporter permease ThiP [Roseobacteraceae]|jgi:thiamine transport system permease protein|uniref:Sulfate transport system permease protein CysW n=1 Tax=Pseudosulfitobacter pseudonitzschiae TaxID=1402135 RepID=A0A221K473_9RHOB|nr:MULTISPECIES: thiamine/thiamine pyrophosphate ABC transporter permease ThiP [Roseobacteraceae]ASM73796.1 sulfate transport system permease protein CysW [Pseudosulfitobacter pseudonitzschiae]
MAASPVQISRAGGIGAAALVVALIAAALGAVAWRAEAGYSLGPADWAAVRFTLWQAFLSAVISVALAVPVARALARRRFVGRSLLIALLGAPFILPVIVAVLGILAVFGRGGWVNQLLGLWGFEPLSIYGLGGVLLAHVFFNLPLATRLILQGWQSIPAERFRLAAQLGLTPRIVFRVLEWPVLLRVVPGALALIFVICLASFAVALTLGGGPRATTIELAIYQAFLFDFDLGRAAVLSLMQLGMAGGAAVLALWLVPQVTLTGGIGRTVRRWDAPKGVRRWLDAVLIGLAAGFLLVPLVSVVLSGLPGITALPAGVFRAAWSSVWVSGLSVCVLLALALPMAGWIGTSRRGGIEAAGLLGFAASPLMIGTGWFILIYPFAAPSSLALPVTALVNALMALPFALRVLVPAVRDVMAAQGRLAAALGLRGWRLWVWVIVPAVRPQVGFAAGLAAALSMGDLGVIALFADQDHATLPLQMYRLMGAYQMEAAAGAALLLIVLAFGAFWICDAWGRRSAVSE